MDPAPARRVSTPVIALLVAVLVAVVYGRSVGGSFLNWDDTDYVTANAELRLPLGEAIRSVFGTFLTGNWNPLQRLTYVLEWKVFGDAPAAFRVTNLLLHAASCVVLVELLDRWLGDRGAAILAAVLFAVHPANVENVAWISERKTLLASFFAFASALAWVRADGAVRGRLLALGLFAAGLLGKTSIVVLPALLLLLDVSMRRRLAWAWYAAFAAVAVPAAVLQVKAAAGANAIESLHGGTWLSHAATCLAVMPRYAGSVIAPFGLVPRHLVPPAAHASDVRIWLGLALLAALAWGTVRSFRGERRFLVAAPWFLATVLPTVIVPIPILQADRYLYLSLPFVLACAAVPAVRASALNRGARLATFAAAAALSIAAGRYADDWRDSTALWTRQLERHPEDAAAWHSLAVARVTEAGDARSARFCYEKLLELDPLYQDGPEGLALLDVSEGRPAAAEAAMRSLVAAHPARPLAWSVLSSALERLGRRDEAERALLDGLAANPGDPDIAANLAQLRAR